MIQVYHCRYKLINGLVLQVLKTQTLLFLFFLQAVLHEENKEKFTPKIPIISCSPNHICLCVFSTTECVLA